MADRYFVNSGNWGTTTNWSSTSGGLSGSTIPTSADDVYFDINSGNCTVDSPSSCKSLTFTGYTNTITMSDNLSAYGSSITLWSGMTISGTGALVIYNSSTLTSNGVVWPNNMSLEGGSKTYTLSGNWVALGDLTIGTSIVGVGSSITINGQPSTLTIGGDSSMRTSVFTPNVNLYTRDFIVTTTVGQTGGVNSFIGGGPTYRLFVSRNFTIQFNGNVFVSGPKTIVLNGTGLFNTGGGSNCIYKSGNIEINTTGTTTLTGAGNNINLDSVNIIYSAGTVVTTGSTLNIRGGFGLYGGESLTWNNLDFNTNSGNLIGFLNVLGDITSTTTLGAYTSGTTVVIKGTGSQSLNSTDTFSPNIIIDKPSGTLTIGNLFFGGRSFLGDVPSKLIYSAGTVNHLLGQTLTLKKSWLD